MSTDPAADRQVDLSEQPGPVEGGASWAPQEESTTHRSLERGLRILGIVVGAQRPISGAEIAGIIGLHRSTVFQLTKMLVRAGLLKQWEISHAFEPGPKMHEYLGLMLGVQMVTETGKLRYPSGEMLRDSLLARQERLYQECKRIAQQHGMRVDKLQAGQGAWTLDLAVMFKGQDPGGPQHLQVVKIRAPSPEALRADLASFQYQVGNVSELLIQPREEVEGVPNQERAGGLLGPDEKGGGLRT